MLPTRCGCRCAAAAGRAPATTTARGTGGSQPSRTHGRRCAATPPAHPPPPPPPPTPTTIPRGCQEGGRACRGLRHCTATTRTHLGCARAPLAPSPSPCSLQGGGGRGPRSLPKAWLGCSPPLPPLPPPPTPLPSTILGRRGLKGAGARTPTASGLFPAPSQHALCPPCPVLCTEAAHSCPRDRGAASSLSSGDEASAAASPPHHHPAPV
jgi:hypothetical protein